MVSEIRARLSSTIRIEAEELALAALLQFCLDQDESRLPPALDASCMAVACQRFLEAGVRSLERDITFGDWLQFGLHLRPGETSRLLYAQIALLARDLLDAGAIRNFFFMHKLPGIRLRFERNALERHFILDHLVGRLETWQQKGMIQQVEHGVYEPETHLFGGPVSMRFVHSLFTADSLAWLDYHALQPTAENQESVAPAWALSLLMLRTLFAGLRITEWEDVDVWDRVCRKTGRKIDGELLSQAAFATVVGEIQACWLNPDTLLEELSLPLQRIVEDYRQATAEITTNWYTGYFAIHHASIGSRSAAALVTIFHWNRAGLSLARQALLAESLAARETV